MQFPELVHKCRSYRRFYQDVAISTGTLRELIDLARLSASARNLQPLKFMLSNTPERNAIIFAHVGWASALKTWPGPSEGERPSAYVLILLDTTISDDAGVDPGIAAQSIVLGAVAKGLGGCMLGSVKRPEVAAALHIPARYAVLLAVALGKPKETVVIDPVPESGNIAYWRDADQVHHVPKRSLDELIIG
jgi:nitroreductase